jgi:tRNA(fMet)-specific endonuclease VapC
LILDMNALSDVADRVSGAVAKFLAADRIALPVIVLGEFRYGIARSRHREEYAGWLDGLARKA